MAESRLPDALAEARKKLEELLRERQQLDIQIAKTEQAVAALKSIVEPDPEEAAAAGFTDVVRNVLRAAKGKGPLSPTQVREGMLNLGKDLAGYAQPMATIHVVLKRLLRSGEARDTEGSDNKRYWWALHGEQPSSSVRQGRPGAARSKRAISARSQSGKRR